MIMNREIKLLDLFSGVGGFSLGLQKAGFKIISHQYSEIDKHAIAVYKNQFKKAEHIGGVEGIKGNEIERPDIITFGSPCQDFSIAGKGKGLQGERSSLILEAIRIINEARPDIFIWENVKGTYSSNRGRDFQAILQAFTNIGGYRFEWQLLNTKWFLPQNRERILLIGHLDGKSKPKVFPVAEDDRLFNETKKSSKRWTKAQYHSGTITPKHRATDTFINVPAISGAITVGGKSGGLHSDMTVIPVLTPDRKEKRQNGRRFKENGEPFFTLTGQDRHGVLIQQGCNKKRVLIRRLTEIECERLQGFPDNWTQYGDYDGHIKEISMTQRNKLLGNAVTVDVIEEIGRRLLKKTIK